MTQAEIDEGSRPGTTTSDAEKLDKLEREVKEIRPGKRHTTVGVGMFVAGVHAADAPGERGG